MQCKKRVLAPLNNNTKKNETMDNSRMDISSKIYQPDTTCTTVTSSSSVKVGGGEITPTIPGSETTCPISSSDSTITLPFMGVCVRKVPGNHQRQLLFADKGPHFSHAAQVSRLSGCFIKLQTLKKDLDSLRYAETVLKISSQFGNLLMLSSRQCSSLSTMSASQITESFLGDLIQTLKETTTCNSRISHLLQCLRSSDRHCEKSITDLTKFNYMMKNSSYIHTLIVHINHVIDYLTNFRADSAKAKIQRFQYSSLTMTIFQCHCFLKSVQKLLVEVNHTCDYTIRGELFNSCNSFPNGDRFRYSVVTYIKNLARKRARTIAGSICGCVENTLSKKDNNSDSGEDVNNNNTLLHSVSRKATKLLRKNYCKLVTFESDFICELSSEIVSLSREHMDTESNKETSLCHSSSTIDWISEKGLPFNDTINKLYSRHLWGYVKCCMRDVYLTHSCLQKKSREKIGCSKIHWNVIASCVVQLQGELAVTGSIDVLAHLLLVSSSYNNIQLWDQGLCKAMALLLKEKFRYVSGTRSGGLSSRTLKFILDNQVAQTDIHSVYQATLKNVIELEDQEGYSFVTLSGTLATPFIIFLDFVTTSLCFKRQQFLAVGNWEQFFVLTSADLSPIINFLDDVIEAVAKKFIAKSELFDSVGKRIASKSEVIKSFECSGFKLFYRAFRYRARNCLGMHIPKGKVWRRRGSSTVVTNPNTYINTVANIIFLPLLDNLKCLSKPTWFEVVQKSIGHFIRIWMDYILDTQTMFSWFGANQLRVDFDHFLQWFEQDQFSQLWDEFREWQPVEVVKDMRSAVMLLMCQPHGSQPSTQFRDVRESLSSISEASVDSFVGDQFDQAVQEINLHDKERWLALRVKSNKRRFLCLSG